ncbi:ketopantoate reductase family protein [Nannocystis punicea]|uniref:NAD(P)-binding domain-containing protein n=1 Tax=Nannocystis punicea TaxID=2995304 RepID=A0ABY7HFE6_9BACT|nr:2-dehydropantoate 2-reductase N-terminal domain-containing protein [Nannocystis poenicansa]WAS98009.1 NAD(P)-binding domain-containing protein [Nannocystis poenicansa]
MRIAVIGPGGIGSTFALQLARAGHEVTVVARTKRLAQLQRDGAIVTAKGERAAVRVSAALDPGEAYDLVLVTVLASQVDAVLPALAASAAKSVMFMFNTFEPLTRLREAVGAERFAFGFPAILASVDEGVLTTQIVSRPMRTPVTERRWAELFTAAGIPSVVEADMESWLRTHAAFVAPVMVLAGHSYQRKAGASWAEVMQYARALQEGFGLVRRLGNAIIPGPMVATDRMPLPVLASLLWSLSRVPAIRKSGAAGFGEPRTLIDAMLAAAGPNELPALRAIRP